MYQAIHHQEPKLGGQTLADGIAVKKPGELTRKIIEELVEDILIVDESAVETGVLMLIELQKVLAEGAGGAGVAALLDAETQGRFAGRKVGVVVTGGNIDVRLLSGVLTRGLVRDGRMVRLRIGIVDRPGVLAQVARAIGDRGGNIIEVYHQRLFHDVPAKQAEVDAIVETRNEDHVIEIVESLQASGFRTRVLSDRADDPLA
jgi:threonine dehydratase